MFLHFCNIILKVVIPKLLVYAIIGVSSLVLLLEYSFGLVLPLLFLPDNWLSLWPRCISEFVEGQCLARYALQL